MFLAASLLISRLLALPIEESDEGFSVLLSQVSGILSRLSVSTSAASSVLDLLHTSLEQAPQVYPPQPVEHIEPASYPNEQKQLSLQDILSILNQLLADQELLADSPRQIRKLVDSLALAATNEGSFTATLSNVALSTISGTLLDITTTTLG